jgi:hypothetical protein
VLDAAASGVAVDAADAGSGAAVALPDGAKRRVNQGARTGEKEDNESCENRARKLTSLFVSNLFGGSRKKCGVLRSDEGNMAEEGEKKSKKRQKERQEQTLESLMMKNEKGTYGLEMREV